MQKYKRVYLMGGGGASAINRDKVKSAEIIAYEDLGTESIKNYTLIVFVLLSALIVKVTSYRNKKYKNTNDKTI